MRLYGSRVVKDLHFCLELGHRLRFLHTINHDHTSSDIFSDDFFVGFSRFEAKASELASVGFVTMNTVDMD